MAITVEIFPQQIDTLHAELAEESVGEDMSTWTLGGLLCQTTHADTLGELLERANQLGAGPDVRCGDTTLQLGAYAIQDDELESNVLLYVERAEGAGFRIAAPFARPVRNIVDVERLERVVFTRGHLAEVLNAVVVEARSVFGGVTWPKDLP